MNTNEYGQPVDANQHVLKESEIVAEQIDAMLRTAVDDWIAQGRDEEHVYAMRNFLSGRAIQLKKDLTDYIMEYAHTEWSKNVRHGVQLGRKDAVAMLTTLLHTYTKEIPIIEIEKVIAALTTEATQDEKDEE